MPSRPDHRKHEERADLFSFVAMDLGEEGLPEFAAALDRYAARILRTESEWLRNHPTAYQATGLQGPHWYGQGFKDAGYELDGSADGLT